RLRLLGVPPRAEGSGQAAAAAAAGLAARCGLRRLAAAAPAAERVPVHRAVPADPGPGPGSDPAPDPGLGPAPDRGRRRRRRDPVPRPDGTVDLPGLPDRHLRRLLHRGTGHPAGRRDGSPAARVTAATERAEE